jgi:hypothetical protein
LFHGGPDRTVTGPARWGRRAPNRVSTGLCHSQQNNPGEGKVLSLSVDTSVANTPTYESDRTLTENTILCS